MKIIYDNNNHAYIIDFEDLQPLFINTDDIVEAKKYLIENMTFEFNNAICEQLSYDGEVISCDKECAHEWAILGMDTFGLKYVCKKCHLYKHEPRDTVVLD